MRKGPPRSSEGGAPTREEIAASGETEISSERAAQTLDLLDQRFLGREFLTWLVYFCDDENGGGAVPESELCDGFRVIVGERVALKAMGDGAGEIQARGAAPAAMADVRYAIAGGLSVREADLFFVRGDRVYQAAVSADGFDLRRVKLPALLSEEDADRARERLDLLFELDRMLLSTYQTFLRQRLVPGWNKDVVPRLREFLKASI